MVLVNLFLNVSECDWEECFESFVVCIQCLGLINLVVIEEYQQQFECKCYLDLQNDDLVEVLEMLENVICKIDWEICNCFKEIFDQINVGFQVLFLKVFGGGMVYLEFIGEDLFDIGVVIMVCLLGKKNSIIYLLFGGEKVLIVLVLVFVIFQLNLVLFCMFDEVDVLLDDVNVGCYV